MRYTAANWPKTFHCRAVRWGDAWHGESLEFHEISDDYPTVKEARDDLALHLEIFGDRPPGDEGFHRDRAPWYLWLLWYLWPRHLKWIVRG